LQCAGKVLPDMLAGSGVFAVCWEDIVEMWAGSGVFAVSWEDMVGFVGRTGRICSVSVCSVLGRFCRIGGQGGECLQCFGEDIVEMWAGSGVFAGELANVWCKCGQDRECS
jgi:hypothetical protein